MELYKSKKSILCVIDILSIIISFMIAIRIRYVALLNWLGSRLLLKTYVIYLILALVCYLIISILRRNPRLEKQSYKEIIYDVIKGQVFFVSLYIMIFFISHHANNISRVVIFLFLVFNIILVSITRILYHNYCIYRTNTIKESINQNIDKIEKQKKNKDEIQHIYIIGSKSIGQYGGYESFVMNLLQQHEKNKNFKYHVACKANGEGSVELEKLPGAISINDQEFLYYGAHCFLINIPEKLGSAQAIFYDIRALSWCCNHIEKNHIEHPIVYILASRIGPFEKKYVERIHDAGGKVWQNPDGHENLRRKWPVYIRKYWKFSERYAVKYADLVVCDSKNIEKYIQDEYDIYKPNTTFIAYGSHVSKSIINDDNKKYKSWLLNHNLKDNEYFLMVGRFVPENNFDIIINEFMRSSTKKDLAIITTENKKYENELTQKCQYKKDKRIKFVGTVYDRELLTKIRQNAFGYLHGHEVGGTNPSLLEAMGSTSLNLLYDIGFNKEVGEDAALYWSKDEGDLAKLIDRVDKFTKKQIDEYGKKAKKRIEDEYTWEKIGNKYKKIIDII